MSATRPEKSPRADAPGLPKLQHKTDHCHDGVNTDECKARNSVSGEAKYQSLVLKSDAAQGSRQMYEGFFVKCAPAGDPVLHDRELCERGIKRFMRPATAGEMLAMHARHVLCNYVIVDELEPGTRTRRYVLVEGEN